MASSPSVLVVQHTAACPPALIGAWLEKAGLSLDVISGHLGEFVPDTLDDHDALLVLGGEMGAYDDERAPWLPATRRLLASAVAQGVPTLAICLGHQLLAVALGGRVEKAPGGQQGGVVDIGLLPAAAKDPLLGALGETPIGLHWNNDLVTELPPEATELARTPAGVQAFRVGQAWGLQWHPEATDEIVAGWAAKDMASGHLDSAVAGEWLADLEKARPRLDRIWQGLIRRFANLV